ncbi:MFS transporter [Roseiconus nitratireducens]|uniref:MFS transporter n=1 Tax=Roseiconus nitratireducens TaxID=2605748 RepID=A0A5M6D6H0_9BACT|nr:MFS transporter [Roseiconus nitratireducens]KAA5543128.1 MFS transporter [Roseiconus nitratireducens]
MTAADQRIHPLRNPQVLCWVLYDWANSAYTTLLITVVVAYLQRIVFPADQWGNVGPIVWAWGISLSMFLGALLSPIVGAIADAHGNKRRWLGITALGGSIASIVLGLVAPGHYVLVVALFITANLMLELSLSVYNGFLPEIATEREVNQVSAWGFGLGYVGGGIALLLALGIIQFGDRIGLTAVETRLRAGLVLMGCWWGIFTLPALWVLSDSPPRSRPESTTATASSSFRDVVRTLKGLRSNPPLAFFLVAFLFYNDGVQTVISQSSTFALQELAFTESDLMGVILMLQFLALPGALLVAKLADRFGEKPSLMACLLLWVGVLTTALFIRSQIWFWVLAAAIALVLGGTQSVSRSMMAGMIPQNRNAEYFGFFNLSGKATSWLGAFLFGAIFALTGNSRWAIFGLLPLFLIGAGFLSRVRPAQHVVRGQRDAPGPCEDPVQRENL